jgi:hypothetical protein
MRFNKVEQPRNLFLLALLIALCCFTIFSSFKGSIILTKANYAGFIAIATCVLSYFIARHFFKRLLGLTLLLSLFHLLNFLPTTINFGFGFGEMTVGIEPLSLLLLVGYYFLNRASANAFIRRYFLPAPTPEKAAQLKREVIDQFKQNFARKTTEGLLQIVQDRRMVTEAIIAAQELLAERNSALAPMITKG